MMSEGLVLSGAVSLPEVRLQITMPQMSLPEWATHIGRAGEYERYGCEDVPWPGEALKPKEAEACRDIAAEYASVEATYKAQFTITYVVDDHCIYIPDSTAVPATIGARPGICKSANGKLTFETTLANQSLPMLGQAPMSELEAVVWSNAPGAPVPILRQTLTLPNPVEVGPSAKVMALIFEHLKGQSAGALLRRASPALAYRADGMDSIRVYALPGWTGQSDILMRHVDPKRVVFHDYDLSKPGTRLGRVEIRFLPPELAGALTLLDDRPKSVLPVYPHHVVLKRDGELQVLSWDSGTLDAAGREAVTYSSVHIGVNGEVANAQDWSTAEWDSSQEFHDAAFNRVGVLSGVHGGVVGSTLLAHFGAPPHGVPPDVLRAAVVGLLRGGKIRIEIPGVGEITSVRDEGARELLKDTGLRKAMVTENTKETLLPRDRNAICKLFKDLLGRDVARDNDAIADAVADRFAGVRERLTELGERFRRLPKDTVYPEALTKLEGALETCRRDRRVEPTVLSVKRSLEALRDGLTLLRRMETDLSDSAITAVSEAENVRLHYWPSLEAIGCTEEAQAAAKALLAHLTTERPWEDTGELLQHVELLRGEYRAQRRSILSVHETELTQAIEGLKRRPGFEQLTADESHQVLRHLREGAFAATDERAIAPALEALEGILHAKRDNAEQKALANLDAILESKGRKPVIEVALDLGGREIADEAMLERLLAELRSKILHELESHHRVRLKG